MLATCCYLLLLAATAGGDVTVENIVVSCHARLTVTVTVAADSLIGEHRRILSRDALGRLSLESPSTAAKLMFAVSLRIAERLRETADKLKMHSQLVQAMQQEIDHFMPG